LNNDQNADWLSSYGRTAKIGFDPIVTERRLRRIGSWNGNGATDFSRMQRNSYGAYGIFTEFSQRQRRNGNGMVETRHKHVVLYSE